MYWSSVAHELINMASTEHNQWAIMYILNNYIHQVMLFTIHFRDITYVKVIFKVITNTFESNTHIMQHSVSIFPFRINVCRQQIKSKQTKHGYCTKEQLFFLHLPAPGSRAAGVRWLSCRPVTAEGQPALPRSLSSALTWTGLWRPLTLTVRRNTPRLPLSIECGSLWVRSSLELWRKWVNLYITVVINSCVRILLSCPGGKTNCSDYCSDFPS